MVEHQFEGKSRGPHFRADISFSLVDEAQNSPFIPAIGENQAPNLTSYGFADGDELLVSFGLHSGHHGQRVPFEVFSPAPEVFQPTYQSPLVQPGWRNFGRHFTHGHHRPFPARPEIGTGWQPVIGIGWQGQPSTFGGLGTGGWEQPVAPGTGGVDQPIGWYGHGAGAQDRPAYGTGEYPEGQYRPVYGTGELPGAQDRPAYGTGEYPNGQSGTDLPVPYVHPHGDDKPIDSGGTTPAPPHKEGSSRTDSNDPGAGQKPESAQDASHPFKVEDIQRRTHTAVCQGAHGDCWFDSTFAGFANSAQGPEKIAQMITRTADGNYLVTFPGDPTHPVKVSASEMAKDHLNDKALWARVIEAALIKKMPNESSNGADPKKALELLTGNSASDQYSKDVSGLDLQKKLEDGPVVATTNPKEGQKSGRTDVASKDSPIVPNHAYTFVSYDAATGTVIVRNPWGNNNGTAVGQIGTTRDGITSLPNGELKMSYDTFKKYFPIVSSVDGKVESKPTDASAGVKSVANWISSAVHDIQHVLDKI